MMLGAVVLIWMSMFLGSHSCLATNTLKGRIGDFLQLIEACLPMGVLLPTSLTVVSH